MIGTYGDCCVWGSILGFPYIWTLPMSEGRPVKGQQGHIQFAEVAFLHRRASSHFGWTFGLSYYLKRAEKCWQPEG